jgi:DNA helicase II / ATP-dependent DNA helicase PcrA
MPQPWNQGVSGTELLPLINLDADTIRCIAGPGSGKTFGAVRRVERILHPDGLAVDGRAVLVVAFNRVIARQLRDEIRSRLKTFDHKHDPVIRTIHALCVEVIGEDLRMLLPHEIEAMIYDVRQEYPAVAARYSNFHKTEQALRDHEAGHAEHLLLWQAVEHWLLRHKAHLVGDLPRRLLERLKGGDFPEQGYDYVIVDEFQDLTPGEQELMFRLRHPGGQLLALGDPRQSIYRFRGNDREGLKKLEKLVAEGGVIKNVPLTQCQRCPKQIVVAANKLMALSGVDEMVPISEVAANIHVVTWKTPEAEAEGMAAAIVKNIYARPSERHLAMVTRRRFGYWLRNKIKELNPELRVELGFSEGLLESWAAREAFILFCLLIAPDPPTWRAWLGYKNSVTGNDFSAPRRSAAAYLKLLATATDAITEATIEALAAEPRSKPRGAGGITIWDRARRFLEIRSKFNWNGQDGAAFVNNLFDSQNWIGNLYDEEKVEEANLDLQLLREKTLALLKEEQERKPEDEPRECLRRVADRLRYQIATREPLDTGEPSDLRVATLWGAKGVTAEHVYILGACQEALPGQRRDEYPGTDADYVDEQKRLFYVSITRAKNTLVISRALGVGRGLAYQLGLAVTPGSGFWANLKMSPFLHDIMGVLPHAVPGEHWVGCLQE